MPFSITIDAKNPHLLASFWAAALPGYQIRPYDQPEIDRLAAIGRTPRSDPSVAVDGNGPTLWFQEASSPGRNRLHLDLAYGPQDEEVSRLRALGATLRDEREGHTVMLDPEGNQFCVFDP